MLATVAFAEDTLAFAEHTLALAEDSVSFLAEDAKTAHRVQTRLLHSGYAPLRADVRCDCRDGVVTLVGNLPSFFLTQVAQSVALRAPGVHRVVNCIRVAWPT